MRISPCKFHISAAQSLIDGVDLPREIFVKNELPETTELASHNLSVVAIANDEVVGILLMRENHIDTIVAKGKGVGSVLLSTLPEGEYSTHVSPKNARSIRMFTKFGFKFIRQELSYGERRNYYESIVR